MASSFSSTQDVNEAPLEDLTFRGSSETTLGVELELQILDPESGDLVPGALRILDVCGEEGLDGVVGEFLLSMFEVKTGICRNVAEVRDTLAPLLRRVHRIANTLGYALGVGGTHPFHRSSSAAIFPDARYLRIHKQQGWLASQEAVFGLHVHVGVPDGERAIGLMNLLVPYLPHLLALSANSPFWQGVDTGFASVRTRMFRPSAHAGIPQYAACWDDFCRFCAVLHEGGVLEGTKDLYWDIRPRPHLGTLEFRIFDAPPTLSCVLGLAALARCLVVHGLRLLDEQPELGRGDARHFWLAQENRWLASRYGLQAECVRELGAARRSLAEDTAALLEQLRPTARSLGEDGFLNLFRPLDRFETGSARQRRLYRQTGTWQAVLDDIKTRWLRDLAEEVHPVSAPLAASLPLPGGDEKQAAHPVPWPHEVVSAPSRLGGRITVPVVERAYSSDVPGNH